MTIELWRAANVSRGRAPKPNSRMGSEYKIKG